MSQSPERAKRPDRVAGWLVLVADLMAFGLTAALMDAAGLALWQISLLGFVVCLFLPFQWAAITYTKVQWWKIDNGQVDESRSPE